MIKALVKKKRKRKKAPLSYKLSSEVHSISGQKLNKY